MCLAREGEKMFFKIFNYFFHNLTKLTMCNFLSNNAKGWWVRDKVCGMRDEGGEVRGVRDEG